ncbi:MAG: hypothetical protein CMH54_02825 [Myxococcales bacterium]|nr:hypothetical protein [Myxococcales bacterium]
MMPTKHIDSGNLSVTDANKFKQSDTGVDLLKDVVIVITQAFGPMGDNLVGISDVTFNGFPAVTVRVRADGQEGLVHLSPFHGDRRKKGLTDIPRGTNCEILCPVSGEPLDRVGSVGDGSGADYFAIYLTPKLSEGELVMVSNVWDHYNSRIVDNFDIVSQWAAVDDI